ncbi:MAG: PEP-CTERM sorting domain-containing protein [Isosphaeraceae bacterium]
MRSNVRVGLMAASAVLLVGTSRDARADYSPQFISVVSEGNNWRWTYNVLWGSQTGGIAQLQTGNGTLAPGAVGSQDFLTLYDIQGYIPGSAIAGGSHTLLNPVVTVGVTAPNTSPIDDPGVANLTFRFNAGTQSGDATFTGFSFLSSFGQAESRLGFYTSQFTRTSSANSKVGEIGQVLLPGVVPEPSSLSLVGLGLVGLIGYGYRRRRQK